MKSRGNEYVQLAHNNHDPETGASRAKVLYNFGRKDQLDEEGLTRLVGSIARFLEKHDLASLHLVESDDDPFEFVGAKQLGGPWLMDGLWERLGIRKTLEKLLIERVYSTGVERMSFAITANRALNPSSKLYMDHLVQEEAFIPGLP